jgi:hypothetical protein
MSTLLTDSVENDLYLNSYNNLAISKTRLEEISQLVTNKLQTFLGEIPTNLEEGVDYFDIVLNKFVPVNTKTNEIVNNILTVVGVIGIESIGYEEGDGIATITPVIQTDAGGLTLIDIPLAV